MSRAWRLMFPFSYKGGEWHLVVGLRQKAHGLNMNRWPDQLDYLNSVGSDGFGRTATEMSLCGTVIWASKLCKDFATGNM